MEGPDGHRTPPCTLSVQKWGECWHPWCRRGTPTRLCKYNDIDGDYTGPRSLDKTSLLCSEEYGQTQEETQGQQPSQCPLLKLQLQSGLRFPKFKEEKAVHPQLRIDLLLGLRGLLMGRYGVRNMSRAHSQEAGQDEHWWMLSSLSPFDLALDVCP